MLFNGLSARAAETGRNAIGGGSDDDRSVHSLFQNRRTRAPFVQDLKTLYIQANTGVITGRIRFFFHDGRAQKMRFKS